MYLQKLRMGLFLTCFSILLFSCQNENTSQNQTTATDDISAVETAETTTASYTVEPRLKDVDVAFRTFEVPHNEAKTIELENGTTIEIPADAFVDANGNPVTEAVELRYREFHDAADVLASGIPMKVMQADGQEAYMQTAGMFEINGYVAELPVQLAENKEIMVNMASNVAGDYDFWNYNEKAGKWMNAGTNTPVVNPKKEAAKQQLALLEKEAKAKKLVAPVKPVKFDKKKPALNFDVNYKAFPELQKMNGIVWQYSGSDPKMSPRKNKWIYKEEWDYVELKKGKRSNEYQMVLSNDAKNFLMDVVPSQKGNQFEESLAEYQKNLAEYKKGAGDIQKQKELYIQQAKFVRSFAIAGMGIHNYDILMKNGDNIRMMADFDFGTVSPEVKNMIPVYLITGDRRSVVAFSMEDWDKFGFDPSQENLLVAVLPGNKLAAFTEEDFTAHRDALANAKNGEYTFKMKVIADGITSMEDLRGMIDRV